MVVENCNSIENFINGLSFACTMQFKLCVVRSHFVGNKNAGLKILGLCHEDVSALLTARNCCVFANNQEGSVMIFGEEKVLLSDYGYHVLLTNEVGAISISEVTTNEVEVLEEQKPVVKCGRRPPLNRQPSAGCLGNSRRTQSSQ